MDQYDEWGNFIGDLSDDEDDQDDVYGQPAAAAPAGPGPSSSRQAYDEDEEPVEALPEPEDEMEVDDVPPSNAVILHDDKKYYPTAAEVFGPDVEAMVEEEDMQPLTEPIIAPIKVRKFAVVERGEEGPETRFSKEFMLDLMASPESIRNLAVIGHLHHGKTSLLDMLVYETHVIDWDVERPLRYTDTHMLAQKRGVSLKSSPLSLVLPTSNGRSHVLNLIDTPGHVNFLDEATAALRLADGAIVVVDAVEGVLVSTEKLLRHLVAEKIPYVLVINKVDRLILELRLPPADAYFKLKHTVEEVNTVVSAVDPDPKFRVSPEKGNVAFASTDMGWLFTLETFAKMYQDTFGAGVKQVKRGMAQKNHFQTGKGVSNGAVAAEGMDEDDDEDEDPNVTRIKKMKQRAQGFDAAGFAKRLWGDVYFKVDERKFVRRSEGAKRSFVHFVMEPLYKLYSQVLGADQATLKSTLATLGIYLKPAMYKLDVRPLLKLVCDEFFGRSSPGLVDMVASHIPSPAAGAANKVLTTYTGPMEGNDPLVASMLRLDPDGPLVVQVTKLYPTHDASEFRAFGRVMSGTAKIGDKVKVLGERYSKEDEEDLAEATIKGVFVSESRYTVEASGIPAGNLVLLSGIDNSISKTATVVSSDYASSDLYIFRPIKHVTQSVLKVAVEPLNPSELPKMLDGLRKVNKTYPLVETRVEESGEHVVLGTGELYLDSVMHDLREMFAEIEIKISDPVVRFCETVVDTSAIKCYAETPNKKNKLTVIAEPLEKGIADDIESGRLNIRLPAKQLAKQFQERYQWDLLASRSVWAFGPEDNGPNILVDDTLPGEVDKKLLATVKEHIKQGFQWGTREGPLCDEPIRNVKFRLLDATLAEEPIYRGGGQIIPTARRVCYAAFMMATPRLMEPVYYVEVQAPADCVSAVYTVLARRRGHVMQDIPKPGSPLYTVKAFIPVVDANGFETDLRTHTQGQAFCQQTFDHWSIVPGDPTDKAITLRPLEPASAQALARDMTLKTRRRKGLGDNLSVAKYCEASLVEALVAAGQEDLLG